MSLSEFQLKDWSGAPMGSAREIQKFGESTEDYELLNAIQIWRIYTNLYGKKVISTEFGANPFQLQGSHASWTKMRVNDIFIDILQTAITSELLSGRFDEITSQLNTLSPTIKNSVLEEKVIKEYTSIPQVKAIATENYRAEKIFTVFIASQVYDDKLMDLLLTKEIEILDLFPNNVFSFRYIPFMSEEIYKTQISAKAKILWGG